MFLPPLAPRQDKDQRIPGSISVATRRLIFQGSESVRRKIRPNKRAKSHSHVGEKLPRDLTHDSYYGDLLGLMRASARLWISTLTSPQVNPLHNIHSTKLYPRTPCYGVQLEERLKCRLYPLPSVDECSREQRMPLAK